MTGNKRWPHYAAGATVSPNGTWTNFSGRESVRPQRVAAPADLDALRRLLKEAAAEGSRVRVVGSGHSYNDIAIAPEIQVSLRHVNRVLHVDPAVGQLTVEGGATLRQIRGELRRHGLAFANMGDIDHQSIAGALSTGTHGTGLSAPAFASQVVALELMLADGSVMSCRAEDGDLLDAARVSLGALGIIVSVTLQAEPAYNLRRSDAVITRDEAFTLLEDPPSIDHIGLYFMPYIDEVLMWTAERTGDAIGKPSALSEWFRDVVKVNYGLQAMGAVARRAPRLVPGLSRAFARGIRPETTVDTYDKVFLRPLFVRHDAVEFAVPQAAGPDCVRTLMAAIEERKLPYAFPCETRIGGAESAWLHPQHGRTTTWVGAAIQSPGIDVDGAWEEAQTACLAAGGRPHWGKWHTLTAAELRGVYPRWDDFAALRAQLDPTGLFGSPAIDRVLGRIGRPILGGDHARIGPGGPRRRPGDRGADAAGPRDRDAAPGAPDLAPGPAGPHGHPVARPGGRELDPRGAPEPAADPFDADQPR